MKPDAKTGRRALLAAMWQGNRALLAMLYVAGALEVALNLFVSWLLQQFTDLAAGSPSLALQRLLVLCMAMAGLFVLTTLLEAWAKPLFYRRALGQYRVCAFDRLAQKGIAAFQFEDAAVYLSALTADLGPLETGYLYCVQQLPQHLLTFAGALALMLWYSPLLTLAAVGFALLPVVAAVLTGGQLPVREKALSDDHAGFLAMLKDLLAGFPVIKAFRAETAVAALFARSNAANQRTKARRDRTAIVVQSFSSLAGIIAQFGVFIVGVWLALRGGSVTAGMLLVFVNLMGQCMQPIAAVPQLLAGRKAALGLVDKLAGALAQNQKAPAAPAGPAVPLPLKQGITLKNVTFGYEPGKPVLQNLNAVFQAGQCYAIVGASGSGKSTLLDLLLAGHAGYTGSIRYDGAELRTLPAEALYGLISTIRQEVFLFNATLRDNVTMFQPFPEPALQSALHRSGLDAVIADRGMDFVCGENGGKLSGGERQRVAIARGLLRQTPVLLADEATAALDTATAAAVADAVLQLHGLTRIVVTHRLEASQLARYDGILVLQNGRVAEQGTFEELLKKKGYFYSLYTVAQ